jgi:hypothetical protein
VTPRARETSPRAIGGRPQVQSRARRARIGVRFLSRLRLTDAWEDGDLRARLQPNQAGLVAAGGRPHAHEEVVRPACNSSQPGTCIPQVIMTEQQLIAERPSCRVKLLDASRGPVQSWAHARSTERGELRLVSAQGVYA